VERGSSTPLFMTRLDASFHPPNGGPSSRPVKSGVEPPHSTRVIIFIRGEIF
jgi:hypothetical protein